jgi:hypothetical protein
LYLSLYLFSFFFFSSFLSSYSSLFFCHLQLYNSYWSCSSFREDVSVLISRPGPRQHGDRNDDNGRDNRRRRSRYCNE